MLASLAAGEEPVFEALPPHPDGLTLSRPLDWSADSSRLLVHWAVEHRWGDGVLTILDVDSGDYRTIESDLLFKEAKFTATSHAVIATTGWEFFWIDLETDEMRKIHTVARDAPGDGVFDVAPDDSWLCYTSRVVESDIWMIEFDEQ